ncbi:MAG: hypothetical protein ABIF10_02995 [Candidatus Woesearchaeota archaeon]
MNPALFASYFCRVGKRFCIGCSAGKVLGVLIFNGKPPTQKEICIHAHLGLVKKGLHKLKKSGFVGVRKNRAARYFALQSASKSFQKLVLDFRKKEIEPIIRSLSIAANSACCRGCFGIQED